MVCGSKLYFPLGFYIASFIVSVFSVLIGVNGIILVLHEWLNISLPFLQLKEAFELTFFGGLALSGFMWLAGRLY